MSHISTWIAERAHVLRSSAWSELALRIRITQRLDQITRITHHVTVLLGSEVYAAARDRAVDYAGRLSL